MRNIHGRRRRGSRTLFALVSALLVASSVGLAARSGWDSECTRVAYGHGANVNLSIPYAKALRVIAKALSKLVLAHSF